MYALPQELSDDMRLEKFLREDLREFGNFMKISEMLFDGDKKPANLDICTKKPTLLNFVNL